MSSNKKIDIINDLLEECILAYPLSSFIISLYKRYQQMGSLSKKQLQGLYGKADGIPNISTAKLATLEAIIKKMPTRYKSELPVARPPEEKDEEAGRLISRILDKYPQHKRVLFFQSRYNNHEPLSDAEMAELKKFDQLLNR